MEWPGQIRIGCGGQCIGTGTGWFPPFVVFISQLSGLGLLMAFPLNYFNSVALYVIGGILYAVVLFLFISTVSSDPGVLPRCAKSVLEKSVYRIRPPRKQVFVVQGTMVTLEYCDTCNIFKTSDTVHCSMCNNCVRRFDHHCPWMGNCIGARNYCTFYLFAVFAFIVCIYSLTLAIITVVQLGVAGSNAFASNDGIGSAVLIFVAAVSILFVTPLFMFHTQLVCTNQTTYESFRGYHQMHILRPVGRGIKVINRILFGERGQSYVRQWAKIAKRCPEESEEAMRDAYALGRDDRKPVDMQIGKEVPLTAFDPSKYFKPYSRASVASDTFINEEETPSDILLQHNDYPYELHRESSDSSSKLDESMSTKLDQDSLPDVELATLPDTTSSLQIPEDPPHVSSS